MPYDAGSVSDDGLKILSGDSRPAAEKNPTRVWSVYGPAAKRTGLMIEPAYADAYHAYAADKSPASAGALLKAIDPVLDESLRSYGGPEAQSVTARAQAKRLALEAVDRYDPARAKLRTHLLSHLRGLRRVTDRATAGVYVPEQWRLDARNVSAARSELSDALGRDASDAEVADKLRIPLARVRKAGAAPQALAASQVEGHAAGHGVDRKTWDAWVESVYHDLDPVDQVILEHSFGLHGRPVLTSSRVAPKVGLSEGAVAQRKSRIQGILDEFETFMGRRG